MDNDDMFNCIGEIEEFKSRKEIDEYFTSENFIMMFDVLCYSKEELIELATICKAVWEERMEE